MQQRLRFRAPALLRGQGAQVRLSSGRRVSIPHSGIVALTGRQRGRAAVFLLSAVRELHDLGFRREVRS